MVSRKLLETFFDMEEKGVMVFHLTLAERRSAGHPALGLSIKGPNTWLLLGWAFFKEIQEIQGRGICLQCSSFLGWPWQIATS